MEKSLISRATIFSVIALMFTANASIARGNVGQDPLAVVPPQRLTPPPVGGSFTCPAFGTTITRLSDSPGAGLLYTDHEYAKNDPFSPDGRYILLISGGQIFAVLDTQTGSTRTLRGLVPRSEPRWSHTEAGMLYFLSGNSIYKLSVQTDQVVEVTSFPEYELIFSGGEQDLSEDGEHYALMGGPNRNSPRHVFLVNLRTGIKGSTLDIRNVGNTPNSVSVTPDNNVMVIWDPPGKTSRYRGLELYDRDMRFIRQVLPYEGHGDMCRDLDGNEVMVITNSQDRAPHNNSHYVIKVRLDNSSVTPLVRLDWRQALHVSCRNTYAPGWAVVSTYSPSNPDPASGDWKPLENEVFAVALDGSERVHRIAHSRTYATGYISEPRASVSRDGRKVIFNSNFGLTSSHGQNYVDAYVADVPADLFGFGQIPFTPPAPPAGGEEEMDPFPAEEDWEEMGCKVMPIGSQSAGSSPSFLAPLAFVLVYCAGRGFTVIRK